MTGRESSRDRHQRTLSEWTTRAIRSMLRSSDPATAFAQQDGVIKDRIRNELGQHRRATLRVILPIVLLAVGVVIVVPAPIVLLPLAGIAVVFVIIVREDRLARLHEAIQRVDPDEDTR
ncbi:MAG: hypothetical protein CL820_03130 [Croceicoccus sp.]|uniref:hypothetical protein n=2 Tax=Microbacteriaceae TaxID=85023 RepID=UPI0002588BA0|nr:hypothetical protein [Microbacterium sp. T2.11-28]EIC07047.1 hypothetical protein OR221_2930 [Microbacterium laevaniformans OR221]MAL24877.1 hypothetical protein [Croceicoccus sp.]